MQPRMTLIHFPWITTPDGTQGLVHARQALCQGSYIPNPEFCFLLTKTLLMTGSLSKRRYTCFLQLHCFVSVQILPGQCQSAASRCFSIETI